MNQLPSIQQGRFSCLLQHISDGIGHAEICDDYRVRPDKLKQALPILTAMRLGIDGTPELTPGFSPAAKLAVTPGLLSFGKLLQLLLGNRGSICLDIFIELSANKKPNVQPFTQHKELLIKESGIC